MSGCELDAGGPNHHPQKPPHRVGGREPFPRVTKGKRLATPGILEILYEHSLYPHTWHFTHPSRNARWPVPHSGQLPRYSWLTPSGE